MLTIGADAYTRLIGHAYDCYPEEACGLLAGRADAGTATVFYACRNTTRSGRVFEIHSLDYQRAEDDAESRGLELVAIVHSHTHTEPYPSPTDVGVATALGPWFRWVIVSLKRDAPETRSYRIADEIIAEERLAIS
jgi:[CysO sulfur-carrier protein]-S-L-cysteine hydrolase